MIFLSALVVLVLMLWWSIGTGLQRDEIFLRWITLLRAQKFISATPGLAIFLAVILPGLLLAAVVYLVTYFLSGIWLFFIYVPVLFYSLGRGDLRAQVHQYLILSQRGDTVAASQWVDGLRANIDGEGSCDVNDWPQLHAQALEIVSYRSFERLFAVLFWFFLLGGVGALVYRLSVLYRESVNENHMDRNLARRWLWLLEWPGVRALSITWALVGNFDSCYAVLRNDFLDLSRSSIAVLSRSLRGALGMTPVMDSRTDVLANPALPVPESGLAAPIISGINTEPDSLGLIPASLSLFSRALLLWLCVIALLTLTL